MNGKTIREYKTSLGKRYTPFTVKPITFLYKYSYCGQVDCNWQSNYKSAYYILRWLSTWYAPSDYTDVNNGKLQHSWKKCILPHARTTLKLVAKMEYSVYIRCKSKYTFFYKFLVHISLIISCFDHVETILLHEILQNFMKI